MYRSISRICDEAEYHPSAKFYFPNIELTNTQFFHVTWQKANDNKVAFKYGTFK